MPRCVIIGGADIGNYDVIRTYLRPDDFVVCCDSGLRHRGKLGVEADLIIADFDSAENPHLAVETIVLPHEKDDTDSMAAVREMSARGYDDFLLIGVFGGRLDHTLANVYILIWLVNHEKRVLAIDDYSEMEVITPQSGGRVSSLFPYFSLVAIAGSVEGVTIKNAEYELDNAVVTPEYQYCVSNEPLPGNTAEITIEKGYLLLIRDR